MRGPTVCPISIAPKTRVFFSKPMGQTTVIIFLARLNHPNQKSFQKDITQTSLRFVVYVYALSRFPICFFILDSNSYCIQLFSLVMKYRDHKKT